MLATTKQIRGLDQAFQALPGIRDDEVRTIVPTAHSRYRLRPHRITQWERVTVDASPGLDGLRHNSRFAGWPGPAHRIGY